MSHASIPSIVIDAIVNIIIELVLLVNLAFFIINFIAGSSISEIINATKKGM